MSRRVEGSRCGRALVTVLVMCLSTVAVVPRTSSLPQPSTVRELFFDAGRADGDVVTVRRGQDVVLNCSVVGTPIPTAHWLYRGRRIIQGGGHDVRDEVARFESEMEENTNEDERALRLGTTKSQLFIDCVHPTDAGQYTCVAETPTHRIATTVVLRVVTGAGKHLKRKVRGNQIIPLRNRELERKESGSSGCLNRRNRSNASPARIYMWTSQRLAKEGQDAQIYCRASGSPLPSVTWFDRYKREILPGDKQHVVLPNGDLLIRKVSWEENMGLYRCRVENSAGADSTDTFFYPTEV